MRLHFIRDALALAGLATLCAACLAEQAGPTATRQPAPTLKWQPADTPTGWIEALEVEQRQMLDRSAPREAIAAAEGRVVQKLTELIAREPGHWSLTERDSAGNTPLTLAVTGAHLHVVKTLLTDPGVAIRINEPLPNGATPWVLASIAPRASLPACQPGLLTVERTPLLRPYWKQMNSLLGDPDKPLSSTLISLAEAGATPDPVRARQFWRLRCPMALPAVQAALELDDDILLAVVKQSIEAVKEFSRQVTSDRMSLAAEPKAGTVFGFPNFQYTALNGPSADPELEATSGRTICPIKPVPVLQGSLNWRGELAFKAIVQVEAGVITGVDLKTRQNNADRAIKNYFSALLIDALSRYVCGGQVAFSQEFVFRVD